jgi:hypothetical protein
MGGTAPQSLQKKEIQVQLLKDLNIRKTDGNTGIGGANGNGLCILAARTFPTPEIPSELKKHNFDVDVLSKTNKNGGRG